MRATAVLTLPALLALTALTSGLVNRNDGPVDRLNWYVSYIGTQCSGSTPPYTHRTWPASSGPTSSSKSSVTVNPVSVGSSSSSPPSTGTSVPVSVSKPSSVKASSTAPSVSRPSSTSPSSTGPGTPSNVTCYSGVYIIVARGTTEIQGDSVADIIARAVVDTIPDSAYNEVVYPASNDFLSSVSAGINNTKDQINDYHAACPSSKIVLMGYSQGAWVIGDTIAGGVEPPISQELGDSVVSVIMFGDPFRVLGLGTEPDTCRDTSPGGRHGDSLANITLYANRLDEWCAAGDPICCLNGTNPLDHASYFTPATEQQVSSFVASRANSLKRRYPGRPRLFVD